MKKLIITKGIVNKCRRNLVERKKFQLTMVKKVLNPKHDKLSSYYSVEIVLRIYKSQFRVLKSHFTFRNYTRACVHHSVRVNITHKSDFYTQSVVLIRMSVIITFVSVIITLFHVNITLCVYKSLL
jgi:hypothetical protein